jgi:hypothetical protein
MPTLVKLWGYEPNWKLHHPIRRHQPRVDELAGLVSGEHLACFRSPVARYLQGPFENGLRREICVIY